MRSVRAIASCLAAGLFLAACSSGVTSASSTTIAPAASGRPSCATVAAGLSQQNIDVLFIALAATKSGSAKNVAISNESSKANKDITIFGGQLKRLLPSGDLVDQWARGQRAYIDGLAAVAKSSNGSAQVNAYNNTFNSSEAGQKFVANTSALKEIIATVCPSAGSRGG